VTRLFIHDYVGFVDLVDKMQHDTALKVVNAARISHGKRKEAFDEKDEKLVKFLWDNEHTSPFRHTYYTFHIKAPIFVFNQWKKYQIGSTWMSNELYDSDKGCSWNEVSGRYTELEPEFFYPNEFRSNTKHNKQSSDSNPELDQVVLQYRIKLACDEAYRTYKAFIDSGVAREQARLVLPQNIYSESYWTVSLQAVLHFLNQRLKPDAQKEIQMYAKLIKDQINTDLDRLGIEL
jgi:thymidylate synthase (FAD)